MARNSSPGMDESSAGSIIPGAYEPNLLPHDRQGAMSGPAYGSEDQPQGPNTSDEETIREREREGGGAPIRHRPA